MAEVETVQFGTNVRKETKDAIDRLAKLEGKNKGEFIDMLVAAWDDGSGAFEEKEVPDTIVLPVPRDREMLIDCVGNLIAAGQGALHENYILAGLSMAREKFKKTLPEYKDGERMRAEWAERREAGTRPLTYTVKGPPLK